MTTKRIQKNLTVMFTDISGFTKHTEKISRDDLMSRLDKHNELLMPVIAHFQGQIVKTIGDAFLITFESPTNGVQCGLYMQHKLREYNRDRADHEQIHIKVSINSGEVTVTDNDVYGDPVNVAAKIEKATEPNEIYFTESVFLSMNKAEVPTTFVKTFRPKGAESGEIKLYKVAMDEEDERYRRIIDATDIDVDKLKTRVIELSNTAEKEVIRYQDTLDALVTQQGKSSKATVIAVLVAAVILAVAIVIGLAFFMPAQKDDPEQKIIDQARGYLRVDKPEDAKDLVISAIGEHGESDELTAMLKEIRNYELNDTAERARVRMAEGEPDEAVSLIKESLNPGETMPESMKVLLKRAEAFSVAKAALLEGDTDTVRENVKVAVGKDAMPKSLATIKKQADDIDRVRELLNDEDGKAKERAASALEFLATSFGDATDNPTVVELLRQALELHLWNVGERMPREEALKRLEEYRKRFISISDWESIETHLDIGSLWRYTVDDALRRQWLTWGKNTSWNIIRPLRTNTEDKPAMRYLLGRTIYQINRKLYLGISTGMVDIQAATDKDPALFKKHNDEIYEMLMEWMGHDQYSDSWVRATIVERYFERARNDLVAGLTAMRKSGTDDVPDVDMRVNCWGVLVDAGQAESVAEAWNILLVSLVSIVQDCQWGNQKPYWPLSKEQVKEALANDVEYDTLKELLLQIEAREEEINNRRGPLYSYTYAKTTLNELRKIISETHPELYQRFEAENG